MLLKNPEIEQTIPVEWRDSLKCIVDDIRRKRFFPKSFKSFYYTVTDDNVSRIYSNLDAYGEELDILHDNTWNTSICRWTGSSWHVLLDLFTVEGGASDLVLFVDVYPEGAKYRFDIRSVHVP
jgi:hypothetical protein